MWPQVFAWLPPSAVKEKTRDEEDTSALTMSRGGKKKKKHKKSRKWSIDLYLGRRKVLGDIYKSVTAGSGMGSKVYWKVWALSCRCRMEWMCWRNKWKILCVFYFPRKLWQCNKLYLCANFGHLGWHFFPPVAVPFNCSRYFMVRFK